MKVAIIVVFFGPLPNYYPLFLDSCGANPNYDWLIFADDETAFQYPPNVHFIKTTFQSCRQLIQSKFSFPISLDRPQKLCDYRCAYGLIFEEYLHNYSWWGHCDLDQIFGNLNYFITEKMLQEQKKLFSLGHLTLYKNTPENNRVFMDKFNGKDRYKEVFSTNRGCGFDEWIFPSINDLYLQSNHPVQFESIGADINPYQTSFETVSFDIENRCYKRSSVHHSIFMRKDGRLYQLYSKDGIVQQREYPYVHLQKRKMADKRKNKQSKDYFIVPNQFLDSTKDPHALIYRTAVFKILNYQFFRVKYNSLIYRIKNSDWDFSNVFRHLTKRS